jgi:hypothetical protein
MARNFNLGDLRAAIDDVNREVIAEQGNGEAPNSVVLSRLKGKRSSLVSHFTPQLIDIALIKILNDVCRQSAKNTRSDSQFDLFEGYRKIPKRVTIVRGIKKETAKLTIAEAVDWLKKNSNRAVVSDHEDFRRLVDECINHSESENDTIEVAWRRIRKEKEISSQLELVS